MSRYRELADAATPRPWVNDNGKLYDPSVCPEIDDPCIGITSCIDGSLITALVNNADAIERLWKAIDKLMREGSVSEHEYHEAVETLRPLFGEE